MHKALTLVVAGFLLASPSVGDEQNFVTLGEAIYDFDGITGTLEIPLMTGGPLSPNNYLLVECVKEGPSSVSFMLAEGHQVSEKGFMTASANGEPLVVEPYRAGAEVIVTLATSGVSQLVRALYDNEPIEFSYLGNGAAHTINLLPEFKREARKSIAGMHTVCELLEL